MNLYPRDVFIWRDKRWRLIETNSSRGVAWIIDTKAPNAWPIEVSLEEIEGCERETSEALPSAPPRSQASLTKLEEDFARLKAIQSAGANLLNPSERRRTITRLASELNCCRKTLEKLLRRYWQRGMTKQALLADFMKCGRRLNGETAGRGRPSPTGYPIYQITEEDQRNFEAAIRSYFLEQRLCLTAAYQKLQERFYYFEDGNGKKILLGPGNRPSRRQFEYYFRKRYGIEVRLRKRHGDKAYAVNFEAKLSDTMADCDGPGHRYEIDATIADVLIVHELDRSKIIGKATVYLIVDRKSRLIVGFYVGLERPCWETAIEAIVSLVESKQELCERYGVPYDPSDWPADGLLPVELLGDRGEMISKASSQLAEALGVEVANTASRMPNHKPNVETRFKLITVELRNDTPGYEPPQNFAKPGAEHYDKEACLTLHELTAQILEAIIQHNRSPLKEDPRTPEQIMRGVEPSPIALWHDAVKQYGCLGPRFDAATVRAALLPRDSASITHEGLLFRGLYYTSEHPQLTRAFIKAKDGRIKIPISYDRRFVDCLYAHLPDGPVLVTLAPSSQAYKGLSFAEVKCVRVVQSAQKIEHEQTRSQVAFESRERRAQRIRNAEKQRDALGKLSTNARRRDIVAARADQQRRENIERADRLCAQEGLVQPSEQPAPNVTGMPVKNRVQSSNTTAMTAAQRARLSM